MREDYERYPFRVERRERSERGDAVSEDRDLKFDPPDCQCALCNRWRKFKAIIVDLCEVDQIWMLELYDTLVEAESELEMERENNESPQPLPAVSRSDNQPD